MSIDKKKTGRVFGTAFRSGGGCFFVRRPLLAVLVCMTAAIWITLMLFPVSLPDYETCRGSTATLTGTVCRTEQKLEGDRTVWQVLLSRVFVEEAAETPLPAPGRRERVLCIMDREPRIDPGARVRVRGKVTPFQRAMNEGEFDARMYYHIQRISWSLRDAEILAAGGQAARLDSLLYHIRKKISAGVDRCFSPENGPIVKAVLTGEKGMLEEETKELYQGAGIIHILSISGLHLSLIGMGLFALSGRIRILQKEIPLPARAAFALLFVFLFGKMTGPGTSSFRAFIMLSLYITAGVIGRTYDLPTAAGTAAFLLLLDQPLYLFHTGFQFSFAAVFSMGVLLPALPGGLPGKCLKALAIPLGTLPVYLWAYGTFPVWSLLLNLIILPLMPALMISAAAAVLIGLLFPAAGIITGIAALPAEWILDLYRILAESVEKLPVSRIVPGRPGGLQTLVFYAMLLSLAAVSACLQMPHVRRKLEMPPTMHLLQSMDNRQRRNAGALCALMWITAAVLVLTFRRPPAFEMDVLYVGQGDGIYITCEGRHYLIDGGSSSKNELAKYTLLPFLHSRGTGYLDGVILTHEDIDHCSGLLELLESAAAGKPALTIGHIYLPQIAEASKGENYRKIEELALQTQVPVSYISRGMRLRADSLTLDCLHPAPGAFYESANEYSTTLLLQYRSFSALLTGDLEGQGENDLLDYLRETAGKVPYTDRERRDLTLLKAAHHGSKYATGEDLLDLAAPDLVVISAGRNNLYGHPHPELLDRLAKTVSADCIYRTDLQGEISIRLRQDRFEIKGFLPDT